MTLAIRIFAIVLFASAGSANAYLCDRITGENMHTYSFYIFDESVGGWILCRNKSALSGNVVDAESCELADGGMTDEEFEIFWNLEISAFLEDYAKMPSFLEDEIRHNYVISKSFYTALNYFPGNR